MQKTKQVYKVEAYGVKGMKSVSWRRSFNTIEAMLEWAEKHDAEILGTRDVEGPGA